MSDEGQILLCNYWLRDVPSMPGIVPALCGMCQCQIGVSGQAVTLKNRQPNVRFCCPKCVYENTSPETPTNTTPEAFRKLALAMGVPEDYIDECEREGIHAIAKRLHEAARSQFN